VFSVLNLLAVEINSCCNKVLGFNITESTLCLLKLQVTGACVGRDRKAVLIVS